MTGVRRYSVARTRDSLEAACCSHLALSTGRDSVVLSAEIQDCIREVHLREAMYIQLQFLRWEIWRRGVSRQPRI